MLETNIADCPECHHLVGVSGKGESHCVTPGCGIVFAMVDKEHFIYKDDMGFWSEPMKVRNQ